MWGAWHAACIEGGCTGRVAAPARASFQPRDRGGGATADTGFGSERSAPGRGRHPLPVRLTRAGSRRSARRFRRTADRVGGSPPRRQPLLPPARFSFPVRAAARAAMGPRGGVCFGAAPVGEFLRHVRRHPRVPGVTPGCHGSLCNSAPSGAQVVRAKGMHTRDASGSCQGDAHPGRKWFAIKECAPGGTLGSR